jgi:mono/diheme cytochrome c family protein
MRVKALLGLLPVLALAGCGGGKTVAPEPQTVIGKVPTQTAPATTSTSGGGGATSTSSGKSGSAGGSSGKAVFAANGCGSCHTLKPANATGTVGPDLDKIDHPTSAFIHQSIVDPNKVVTKGFKGGIMPQDFGTKLSPDEIDALVEYLLKAQK